MQSDDRVAHALHAMSPSIASYRAAVVDARERLGSWLRVPNNGNAAAETAAALGHFAAGRIDVPRFAAMFSGTSILSPLGEAVVGRALEVLDDILARDTALVIHELPAGGDLHTLLDTALSDAGRVFQAVAVAQSARQGMKITRPDDPLRLFPYERWNRLERAIAPPMIVRLRGSDVRPGALMDFLDGTQKIVLVVDGPMSPAPLARVITPGLFVAQSDDEAVLGELASFAGAGTIALGGEGAARFTHDPRRRAAGGPALHVAFMPAAESTRTGGRSGNQQSEEVAHLQALASAAPATFEGAPVPAEPSPVDTLASWLLQQAAVGERAPGQVTK
jgi:hypothetical protein